MKKATILICDDDAGIRDALKLILGDDFELIFSTNGKEALDELKAIKPDLIIMDVKMPHMGGLDTLRHIKKTRPSVPILMATGYESSDVAQQAINLGATDYIVKPFNSSQMRSKVESLLA